MTTPSLEARLRLLEQRSRIGLAAGAAALGALVLTAFARTGGEVVSAGRFELVDGEGRVRAELGIDDDGSAGLFVRDEEGRLRASLTYDEAQAAMYLWDEGGTIRVGAAQYAHGGGGFALHGEESRGAAVLYLTEGAGSLTIYDAEGAVRAAVPE